MDNRVGWCVAKLARLVTPFLFIIICYALAGAEVQTSELILSEQIIEQLASPGLTLDGSIETQLLKLNPSFSTVTISHQQDEISLELTPASPEGDEKLVLVTNPRMWFMTRMGPQPPLAEERVANWLKVTEQPQIRDIKRFEQEGNTYWKITAQLAEATLPAGAQPQKELSQSTKTEIKSNGGFSQRVMDSNVVVNFKKGGFIMYLILMCSIGGLYIALERAYVLRRKRLIPDKFVQDVLNRFSKDYDNQKSEEIVGNIIELCEDKDIPTARTLRAGLMVYKEGILGVKSAISSANTHEGAIMERGVDLLGVFANISPLLGLLGTVTGMIKAFEMISVGGSGRPEVVANGISEALITTAGGLFVGIPLLLLYFFFQGKIDDILIDLEEFSLEVVEKLMVRSAQDAS